MDDQPGPIYVSEPRARQTPSADRPFERPDFDHPAVERPNVGHERFREAPPPQRPRSWWRRILGWLLFLLIIGAAAAWFVFRSAPQGPPAGRFQSAGPMPVGTATVTKGDMPVILTGLGTVTPLATVTVKTQINGQLIEVAFQEGQIVKKGDFLAQIDPRPYQVALEQAQGQLAKDQAALKNSQVDLERYRTLVAQNSIARQTLDTQAALVQQNIGAVQADQAQVDAQKLNLTYCRIVSPVGGRVGLRQVDAGNFVQTSDANGIVVITQIQPISVIFTLAEDNLPTVLRRIHAGAKLQVTAFDRTGTIKLDTGRLETIDNQIDPTTGTVRLRAVFDNAAQDLFPNQFVNAQLLVDTLHDTPIVPVSAVQRGAPGTFVYVVKPDHTVTAQPVTLGPSEGQRVSVSKGLEPGDQVVTDGADRLKDGAKVTPAGQGRANAQPGSAEGQGAQPPAARQAPPATAPAAGNAPTGEKPAGDAAQPNQQRRGQGRRGAE
jgi:multidrug efflux system membrane fusion protein